MEHNWRTPCIYTQYPHTIYNLYKLMLQWCSGLTLGCVTDLTVETQHHSRAAARLRRGGGHRQRSRWSGQERG